MVELVPADPGPVHVLDDADDRDRLAEPVIESLAERVRVVREQVLGEGLRDDRLRRRVEGFRRRQDLLGLERSAGRQLDSERRDALLVDVVGVAADRLVGRDLARPVLEAARAAAAGERDVADDARRLDARQRADRRDVLAPARVVVEVLREARARHPDHVRRVHAGRAIDLVHALLDDVDRIHEHGKADRDLEGDQDRAGAIAPERGGDGTDVPGCHVIAPSGRRPAECGRCARPGTGRPRWSRRMRARAR